MAEETAEEVQRLLKEIVDHFELEDKAVRERQIKVWRRLKLLWENIQHTYYSEVAHDWRTPDYATDNEQGSDQAYYDKPVNVFRAYIESIIAALSITVPPVTCYPDDADNPLDLMTAKAGNKIAELIFKHNDAPLLWLHALFIHYTEGMLACYNYSKESEEYGTYEESQYKEEEKTYNVPVCPSCGTQLSEPASLDSVMPEICPGCGQNVMPQMNLTSNMVSSEAGTVTKPKSRVCLEIYGGLFIKVPVWARNQKDCSYLIYACETHFSNVLEQYPELRDKIHSNSRLSNTNAYDQYEQFGRLSPQYRGEYPINNVTVRNCWLRSSTFNILQEEETKELKKLYPDGVKVVLVNDSFAEAIPEKLDDRWTLSYNPLSDYIHYDPAGLLLVSVQDITNDLISLVLQTIEH